MFDYLKRILSQEEEKEISAEPPVPSESENLENKLQVATAALYVEIAAADGDFSEEERKKIVNAMKENFNLTNQCVDDLISLSGEAVKNSISVYEFTSILNDHLNRGEKLKLMTNLWKLIYTDGRLEKHEDRLIKIIGSTLNLDHKDVINSKLLVKQELRK
jgi:uncharacterized tellurite resistance protein B-like protein